MHKLTTRLVFRFAARIVRTFCTFGTFRTFGAIAFIVLANPSYAQEAPWYSFSKWLGIVTVGSGTLATEIRVAEGFQEVAVAGSIKVLLRQSGREGVEISADNNLLPLIETRVSDGTLHIKPVRGAAYTSNNPVTVTVDFKALKTLSLGGSGVVTGTALKGATLKLAIGGSGDVKLSDVQLADLSVSVGGSGSFAASGRSNKLTVSVGGSGGVLTEQLDADDVSIALAGSGGAVVKANRTLRVSIAGSGSVVHSGNAVPSTSLAGSGTVMKR